MRFAFAGDRDIAVRVLEFIVERGERPVALLLPENPSHADRLRQLSAGVPVFPGREFVDRTDELSALDLDYIIGIHFPHLFPAKILEVPCVGVLNLHPAYLPYNRGWHTPSWSILDDTPSGATLHFMDNGLDTGDVIHQKQLDVRPEDTAHTLYQRLKDLEFDVFAEAWPNIVSLSPPRRPQQTEGTLHRKADLAAVQALDLDAPTTARDLIRKLRSLTTDRWAEAAYFEEDGRRFRVQVKIVPEE